VVELADVFRRFAGAYLAAHGPAMPASHRRVVADIIACRTQALGGHLWRCDHCSAEVFAYHSCKNRSCPKCHTAQTQTWFDRRRAEMLPAPYFHVIITVPEELRRALRSNQRDGYSALIKAAAEAVVELARDRRFVGGTVSVLAVLHTWTQQLLYHPHVHCLVTGGGVSADGRDWCPARKAFLIPPKALAKLVRGKLEALLRRRRPDLVLPRSAWRKPWIVHITSWGAGEQAVLDISPAMSSAWPSPTPASPRSTTKP
jgi:Transposase zinc-binding domain/Putative transposase